MVRPLLVDDVRSLEPEAHENTAGRNLAIFIWEDQQCTHQAMKVIDVLSAVVITFAF